MSSSSVAFVTEEYKKYSSFVLSLMVHTLITMVLCFWVLAGDSIPHELMAWKVFHIITPPLALHIWYCTNFPIYYLMMTMAEESTKANTKRSLVCDFSSLGYNQVGDGGGGSNNNNNIELENCTRDNTMAGVRFNHSTTQVHHSYDGEIQIDRYKDGMDRVRRGVIYICIMYGVLLVLDVVYLGVVLIPTMVKCLKQDGSTIPEECDGWTLENNGKVLFGFTILFAITHITSELSIIINTYLKKSKSYEVFKSDRSD